MLDAVREKEKTVAKIDRLLEHFISGNETGRTIAGMRICRMGARAVPGVLAAATTRIREQPELLTLLGDLFEYADAPLRARIRQLAEGYSALSSEDPTERHIATAAKNLLMLADFIEDPEQNH
jgi:hypothetical protein